MARRPNYSYEKMQRERAKAAKKERKREEKAAKKQRKAREEAGISGDDDAGESGSSEGPGNDSDG